MVFIIEGGNSHDGGRPSALGTEGDWPSNVYQQKVDGTLAQMAGTGRYNIDQTAGGSYTTSTTIAPAGWDATHAPGTYAQISPAFWYAQGLAAKYPTATRFVFVCGPKNATAFNSASNWVPNGTLLNGLIANANAAISAHVALGYTVQIDAMFFHVADPDYDDGTAWDAHRANIDGMIAQVRDVSTGITGFGNTPICFGTGMTKQQLDSISLNNLNYQSNYAGVHKRNAYTAPMDTNNARYGYSTGIPLVPMVDVIHENYAGVQIIGQTLREAARLRALANSNPRTPFHNLSFYSALDGFWDFASGGNKDFSSGGTNTLGYIGVPLNRYDTIYNDQVYNRPSGTTRIFSVPNSLGGSYTKAVLVKHSGFVASQAYMEDTSNGTVSRHNRFRYAQSTDVLLLQHGDTLNAITTAALVPGGMAAYLGSGYNLITGAFDAASGLAEIRVNGTLVATGIIATGAFNTGGWIGGSDVSASNPLTGSMRALFRANRALAGTEISELWAACQAAVY